MSDLPETFLEFCETLPESYENVVTEFLRQVSKATSVVEINIAAGLALQNLKGIKG